MAEIVRRKSWGGVLPLGRHASIRGSSFIQCASVSIALSSVQEGQTARHHKQFKLEQALARNYDYCIEEVVAGQKDAARTETKALLHHIHKCVEVCLQVEDTLETNGMRD